MPHTKPLRHAVSNIVEQAPAIAPATIAMTIEQAWEERRAAYHDFEEDPDVLYDDTHAQTYWRRIDAAEASILASVDSSLRATEIRLWTAWSHTDRAMAYAITQGDATALRERFNEFEWHEKMLFTAILNLRGEKLA